MAPLTGSASPPTANTASVPTAFCSPQTQPQPLRLNRPPGHGPVAAAGGWQIQGAVRTGWSQGLASGLGSTTTPLHQHFPALCTLGKEIRNKGTWAKASAKCDNPGDQGYPGSSHCPTTPHPPRTPSLRAPRCSSPHPNPTPSGSSSHQGTKVSGGKQHSG